MKLKFSPMYGLFTPESVVTLLKSKLPNTVHTRILLDMLLQYYEHPDAEQDMHKYSAGQVSRAAREWKKTGIASTGAGWTMRISPDLLKENLRNLEYTPFPSAIHNAIARYRDATPEEILYIAEWVREASLTEKKSIERLNRALALDARMPLQSLVEYLIPADDENETDNDWNYTTAAEILQRLGRENQRIGEREIEYIRKWTQMGFTKEDMLMACGKMIETPTMRYLDAILTNARKVMDSTGVRTYRETIEIADSYRQIAGAAGKKDLAPEKIICFAKLLDDYDPESIRSAIRYSQENSPRTGNRIYLVRRLLDRWKDNGLTEPEKIREFVKTELRINALLRSITDVLALENLTPAKRSAYCKGIRGWLEKGHEEEDILYAADLAAQAEAREPLAYMHKLLKD